LSSFHAVKTQSITELEFFFRYIYKIPLRKVRKASTCNTIAPELAIFPAVKIKIRTFENTMSRGKMVLAMMLIVMVLMIASAAVADLFNSTGIIADKLCVDEVSNADDMFAFFCLHV
jgi:hypothetical protein